MQPLPTLNLPQASLRMRETSDGRTEILDPLRGKFVALTPEEWVRQNFTLFLIDTLGYPRGLMANEVALRLNSTLRRCDTVVYSRRGMRPLMIVEYKAPHVAVTQRVFDQIARYNMVMGAEWLVVTNGMEHYCCRMRPDGGYVFAERIPAYSCLDGMSR